MPAPFMTLRTHTATLNMNEGRFDNALDAHNDGAIRSSGKHRLRWCEVLTLDCVVLQVDMPTTRLLSVCTVSSQSSPSGVAIFHLQLTTGATGEGAATTAW